MTDWNWREHFQQRLRNGSEVLFVCSTKHSRLIGVIMDRDGDPSFKTWMKDGRNWPGFDHDMDLLPVIQEGGG